MRNISEKRATNKAELSSHPPFCSNSLGGKHFFGLAGSPQPVFSLLTFSFCKLNNGPWVCSCPLPITRAKEIWPHTYAHRQESSQTSGGPAGRCAQTSRSGGSRGCTDKPRCRGSCSSPHWSARWQWDWEHRSAQLQEGDKENHWELSPAPPEVITHRPDCLAGSEFESLQ